MKLSEDLKETYDEMIEYGTGGYDIVKIVFDAMIQAEQLESELSSRLTISEIAEREGNKENSPTVASTILEKIGFKEMRCDEPDVRIDMIKSSNGQVVTATMFPTRMTLICKGGSSFRKVCYSLITPAMIQQIAEGK